MSDYERWLALPESLRPIGPKFCPACGKATGTTMARWQEHVAHCPHRGRENGAPGLREMTLSEDAARELVRLLDDPTIPGAAGAALPEVDVEVLLARAGREG
jgi:hypothetical protein